ncbi:MAG TPA: RNase adapter RapZ [Candidatus Angelobacter sp.]|nr:RNase adapter RapZ [Candidatus Angelobacter sp.]
MKKDSHNVLKLLFERHFHRPTEQVQPLQGDLGGSGRNIVRLSARGATAVGVVYDVRGENVAFLEFSRHFRRHGLPVPEIYGEDLDSGAYLEEDLGDTTLFQFLSRNRAGDEIAPPVVEVYRKVVEVLPRFQIEAGRDLNYRVCYPRSSFDRQSISWDLNYFKYYFLKLADIPFSEQALEVDFGRLMRFLLSAPREYFLYRDFQSRNVMLRDGRPFFLDYQGGRKGALHYDIASLLYDAKADLPPAVREQLLDHYLKRLGDFIQIGRDEFMHHYYAFVYIRIMQALGAYGFRGFYERKPHFLQSVPFALKNLEWLLGHVILPLEIPTLLGAFRSIIGSDKLRKIAVPADPGAVPPSPAEGKSLTPSKEKLLLRIFSFSFHQNLAPKDESGNGGGFVFDARGLPNPGREARFKELTGRDAPVIEYLRQYPVVEKFLADASSMVETSLQSYQERGFTSLMVSFGCTGGQHRSVYLAEKLAARFRNRPGVEVQVRHVQLEKLSQ